MLDLSKRNIPAEVDNRTAAYVRIAHPAGRLINRLLAPAGIRVTHRKAAPDAPYDLRTMTTDPIEAAYVARSRPFLIEVDLQICRTVPPYFCTFGLETDDPFVQTLVAYGRGTCRAYAESPLHAYYQAWQPRNAAEALGLDPHTSDPSLCEATSIGGVTPWWPEDPKTCVAQAIDVIERENRLYGAPLPYSHGCNMFGPVSDAKGSLEFDRLTRVYDSILRDGFRRTNDSDGDIEGYIFVSSSVSRIAIENGFHRIVALAALRYKHVPIRLIPFIIRRDDVTSWPNVRNGLFTPEQALSIFDRVFEGRQPRGCHWPPCSAVPEEAADERGRRA